MWEFPISSEKLKTTEDPSVRAGIPARTEGPFYDLQVRPPGLFPVVSCCAPVPAAIKAEAVLGVPAGSRQLSGNKKTVEDACASSTVFFLKNGAIGASRTRDPLLRSSHGTMLWSDGKCYEIRSSAGFFTSRKSISYHPMMADISMFFTVPFAHVLAGR